MPFRWSPREHIMLGTYLLKWTCIVVPVSIAIGTACALFLWLLERATQLRFNTPWLLFLLPLAGAFISLIYSHLGHGAEGGNNLLMDAIHGYEDGDSGITVPRRMAPLIVISTIITILFGGSVGREGTAVQMGGSVASAIGRWFRLKKAGDMRILLMAGIAAGFGAVFGTPLTGAIFSMEVLAIGRMSYDAMIPCLMAAIIGDRTCLALGIRYESCAIATVAPEFVGILTLKVILASVLFGLVSVLFAEMIHSISKIFRRSISRPWLRPVVGGVMIIGLTYLIGSRDYLGLGVTSPDPHGISIMSCFTPDGATPWSWWWKILFTAITLGSGFKGGEVTPLFFIGASLGNILATLMGAPVDLFAALGFVAVLAGATNTPLACAILGIELFGSQYTHYFAVACFLSYLCSGTSGIYLSQRVDISKLNSGLIPPGTSLRAAREIRLGWGKNAIRRRSASATPPSRDT